MFDGTSLLVGGMVRYCSNLMCFIQQDESWCVLLCCLGLGVLRGFVLKHFTNAPYYLPAFTKVVLSELF